MRRSSVGPQGVANLDEEAPQEEARGVVDVPRHHHRENRFAVRDSKGDAGSGTIFASGCVARRIAASP
jgi:hypothetical protein